MKKYIKPNVLIVAVKVSTLLNQNSINDVKGLDGVQKGGIYGGGSADSRAWTWDEEDDY